MRLSGHVARLAAAESLLRGGLNEVKSQDAVRFFSECSSICRAQFHKMASATAKSVPMTASPKPFSSTQSQVSPKQLGTCAVNAGDSVPRCSTVLQYNPFQIATCSSFADAKQELAWPAVILVQGIACVNEAA